MHDDLQPALYRQKLKRVCILKARQLGFSTLLGIVCLDQLCWSVGRQVSLVDKTQEDARQKLKNIVALAYDSLHAELKARFLVDRANAGEFGVRFHEYESAQTSTMYAATHARGGSNACFGSQNGAISRPPTYKICRPERTQDEDRQGCLDNCAASGRPNANGWLRVWPAATRLPTKKAPLPTAATLRTFALICRSQPSSSSFFGSSQVAHPPPIKSVSKLGPRERKLPTAFMLMREASRPAA
jgi:hypothetical protein